MKKKYIYCQSVWPRVPGERKGSGIHRHKNGMSSVAWGQLLLSTVSRDTPSVNADTLAQGTEDYLMLNFFHKWDIYITPFMAQKRLWSRMSKESKPWIWKTILVLYSLCHHEFIPMWFLHCTWIRLGLSPVSLGLGTISRGLMALWGSYWVFMDTCEKDHWHQWYCAKSIHHSSRDGLDWSSQGMRKRQANRHVDIDLRLSALGSHTMKPQNPRSSAHLLYRVE